MNKKILFMITLVFLSLNLIAQEPSCKSDLSKKNTEFKVVEFQNSKRFFDKSALGITNSKDFFRELIPFGQAEVYNPGKYKSNFKLSDSFLSDDNMYLNDSVFLKKLLPAGQNLGVKINVATRKFEIISPYNLTDEAKAAVQKAPKWIRNELERTLSQLYQNRQIELANIINNSNDPYIDEIAYAIAYSSTVYLNGPYCYPQLFIDNAQDIYSHDTHLNYVEVVDYGTSDTDEDYYSTLKYYKIDADNNKIQIEVPKEIYYEYVVHPKITDEIPAYIDAQAVEYGSNNSHTLNITGPETGKFWRDYLFNHTEERIDVSGTYYPVLKESMSQCEVLWDETNIKSSAVKEITNWINDVMDFTSGAERPHQPIRIYSLHIGRCGEHEDLAAAVARACIIPCRGIEAYSSDHVWNEFWDEQWWQWEPVNNSYKDFYCYSKGWKKKFGSIFARESPGAVVSVTDSYCENTSQLTIYALDANNKPIDGALVQIAAQGTIKNPNPQEPDPIIYDTYGTTDNEGKCIFAVDSNVNYFARVDCSIGSSPSASNSVIPLMQNTLPDTSYQFFIGISNSMPRAKFTNINIPSDTTVLFSLKVNYTLHNSLIKNFMYFDDLNNQRIYSKGPVIKPNIFITDEENFNKMVNNIDFQAISKTNEAISNSFSFNINSEEKNWYCIFNNDNILNNYASFSASFALYLSPLLSVENNKIEDNFEISIFPNPVTNEAQITFNIQNRSLVNLEIVNSNGYVVNSIVNTQLEKGEYKYNFQCNDINMNSLNSGIYLLRLTTDNSVITKKFIILN